jgi:hypothetical protein
MQLSLELAGILLAVIDFTGNTGKLELLFDSFRNRLIGFLRGDRYKKIKKIVWLIIIIVCPLLIIIGYLSGFFRPFDINDSATGNYFLYMIGYSYVMALVITIILSPIWVFLIARGFINFLAFTFYLLNIPRAGTVGTLGLILALGSFAYGKVYT